MTDSIFIVVAYGGEYDDAWESNVVAFSTSEEATVESVRLAKRRDYLTPIYNALITIGGAAYPTYTPLPKKPKGPATSTPESQKVHQAQVAAWDAECAPIIALNEEAHNNYHRQQEASIQSKINELELTPETIEELFPRGNLDFNEDVSYQVEQVPFR